MRLRFAHSVSPTRVAVLTAMMLVASVACGPTDSTATGAATGPGGSAPWGALGPGGLDDSPDGLVADPSRSEQSEVIDVLDPGATVPSLPAPDDPLPGVLLTPSDDTTGGPDPRASTGARAAPTTAPAPPAGSARAVERLGSDERRTTAARALGLLRYDWQRGLPGWQIRFLPGQPGVRGYTYPDLRVVEVFVRDSDSPEALAHVVAHELGHAVDVTYLDDAERAAWRTARGIPPQAPWFPGFTGAADFASGSGDFAESFAWVVAGPPWFSELGPPPDRLQSALLAQLASP